jgi:alginate O-acetyltransferase complex protein AlgI
VITAWAYWIVLAATVPLFWILPERHRLRFLAAVSFGYLLSLTLWGTIALLLWSLAFFYLTPTTSDGKLRWASTVLTLGILGYLLYFKYIPPLIAALGGTTAAHVAVPLGLSYFTFKLIHYTVEARRGNVKNSSIDVFLSYMFLFPIFTAGPIERYDHYTANQESRWKLASAADGVTRIVHGLIKKFVIAGMIVAPLFGSLSTRTLFLEKLSEMPPWKVWAYMLLGFLTMYLDFSAYSDIAIGSARLFGIRIMENFNWPILAPNIGEFWRRWHMTLAAWCQAYVYLPTIGITRNPWLAIYSTFVVMGLWHSGSPHWISWGLYHATGLSVFVLWYRFRRRRGWTFMDSFPCRVAAIGLTVAFVTSAGATILPHQVGTLGDSLLILRKLLFIA